MYFSTTIYGGKLSSDLSCVIQLPCSVAAIHAMNAKPCDWYTNFFFFFSIVESERQVLESTCAPEVLNFYFHSSLGLNFFTSMTRPLRRIAMKKPVNHRSPLSIIHIYRELKQIFFKARKALQNTINLIKLNFYLFTSTGSALCVFTGLCSFMLHCFALK